MKDLIKGLDKDEKLILQSIEGDVYMRLSYKYDLAEVARQAILFKYPDIENNPRPVYQLLDFILPELRNMKP